MQRKHCHRPKEQHRARIILSLEGVNKGMNKFTKKDICAFGKALREWEADKNADNWNKVIEAARVCGLDEDTCQEAVNSVTAE
mgnify:CR=1 FL=1